MQHFHDDDGGYKQWIEDHVAGYVLNLRPGARSPMLHSARCGHLYPPTYGRLTRVPKLCDDDRQVLESWAWKAGHTLAPCASCKT